MNKTIARISMLFLLSYCVAGCQIARPDFGIKDGTLTWLDVMNQTAEDLNLQFGGNKRTAYQIVPIHGVIHSLGTPMALHITSSPLSSNCTVPDSLAGSQMTIQQPSFKKKKSIGYGFDLSQVIPKSFLASLRMSTQDSSTLEFTLSELTQTVVPEDKLLQALMRQDCFDAIRGRKQVWIVRGYLSAKMKFLLTDATSIKLSPATKVGQFSVSSDVDGTVSIDDPQVRPRFFIVAGIENVPTSIDEMTGAKVFPAFDAKKATRLFEFVDLPIEYSQIR